MYHGAFSTGCMLDFIQFTRIPESGDQGAKSGDAGETCGCDYCVYFHDTRPVLFHSIEEKTSI